MRPELSALITAVCMPFLLSCETGPASTERSLQTVCTSYADSLNVMATRNSLGLVSRKTQDKVTELDAIVGPICDGSAGPMDPNQALLSVEAALIALIAAKRETDGS